MVYPTIMMMTVGRSAARRSVVREYVFLLESNKIVRGIVFGDKSLSSGYSLQVFTENAIKMTPGICWDVCQRHEYLFAKFC